MKQQLEYRRIGWKYCLVHRVTVPLPEKLYVMFFNARHREAPVLSPDRMINRYLSLTKNGELLVSTGYAWDGASGPTFDTDDAMYAALVHDALYQCIRLGALDRSARVQVDRLFRAHLKTDGMPLWRRNLWYWFVRKFGASSCEPKKGET